MGVLAGLGRTMGRRCSFGRSHAVLMPQMAVEVEALWVLGCDARAMGWAL